MEQDLKSALFITAAIYSILIAFGMVAILS
ncbi:MULTISPECIES: YnhF family membrane protein [Vibrio]|uniref:YnhF family membrane protein n=1 Tax=Vibrio cortegadensis TaxID=1328770 RepID=A0ABV4M3F4_9VIBR|nr:MULTISPECIES: YnhF family membrane protein [Vibrio]MDN3698630.1 YnhF family membrane protein [Vibrio cortegadensis]NOH83265.1 YnhF family membrane protein [Vibrio sp. 03-59-1]RBW66496.1 YnhF family membrane protein [Vibrionales bacterium C3R12]TKF23791.1 YnhF family membrane protein [Vibrio genomosp. F6]